MDQSKNSMVDFMNITLEKIRTMIDVNTIVGETIRTDDGTVIIPVSRLSFGFGTGGYDFGSGNARFAGGGGAGMNINPVAFLVVTSEEVKLLPVTHAAVKPTALETAMEAAPGLIDKIMGILDKNKKKKEDPFGN